MLKLEMIAETFNNKIFKVNSIGICSCGTSIRHDTWSVNLFYFPECFMCHDKSLGQIPKLMKCRATRLMYHKAERL
jgi:hypothetical protein